MFRINTIPKLTLIGLALVALPLCAGLIAGVYQFGQLSNELREQIARASAAIETGRVIVSDTLSLERTAGQFLVLSDAALLIRYDSQRQQLLASVQELRQLPLNTSTQQMLATLTERESQLWQTLKRHTAASIEDQRELPDLSSSVAGLPSEITGMVTSMVADIDARINDVRRFLFYHVVALIPLAGFVASFFILRITRPLQATRLAIRRLAGGDRDTPIEIRGPEDTRELGEQLDDLRRKLAEIDAQKLVFLQHVSHELKTPLTAIREGAALLQEGFAGPMNPAQKDVVNIIDNSSRQLQKEVSALLDFNHAINAKSPDYYTTVPLHELIGDVLQRHRPAIQRRSVAVQLQLQSVTLAGDEKQLATIVDNLIGNALRYTPEGGGLNIHLATERQHAVFEVIDEGPGIPVSEQRAVFQPFVQGTNPVSGVISGTGLGLAIVARYCELHGGDVRILPSAIGTHIRVTLPHEKQGSTS